MAALEITELLGDGIGPELEAAVASVVAALPIQISLEKVDWSIQRRRSDGDAAIDEGVASLQRTRLALKYPTVTESVSPNALLRRRIGFSVIYRPAISIPGIYSNFREDVNLHVVRIGTGGTYEDPGQLVGDDAAVSIRMVERKPCHHAAVYAFELARRNGWSVTSSSKHTIQRVTDGLFEEVVEDVHDAYPDIDHNVELFDALLGKVILWPERYQVVLVLNEYGDFLSDMASGLVGSLGTGASGNFAFDEDHNITVAMFDPAGGTAPDIAGKNLANPAAMFLALAMLLEHIRRDDVALTLRSAVSGCIADGEKTRDIGGTLSTTEFTAAVCQRLSDGD